MDFVDITAEISKEDFDVEVFVRAADADERVRDEIVGQMIHHPHIMVYYHCFYVASKGSRERPELYYRYWDAIEPLLGHSNSYHRDFALTILANLTAVDAEDRFAEVFDTYFSHLNDVKFMTGECCVRNALTILRNKPDLRERIVGLLLDVDRICTYPEKQKALLKYDVLEIFEQVYTVTLPGEEVANFIKSETDSISPKTRRKAWELAKKYSRVFP